MREYYRYKFFPHVFEILCNWDINDDASLRKLAWPQNEIGRFILILNHHSPIETFVEVFLSWLIDPE